MTELTRTVYDGRWRKVVQFVLQRDNYECQIKGPRCEGVARTGDHIIPWRQGGARLDPENVRAACRNCNSGRPFRAVGHRRPSREW